MVDEIVQRKQRRSAVLSKVHSHLDRMTGQAAKEAKLFKLMAECSVDALFRLSHDLHCLYASPSATAVLGWSFEEILACRPWDLIHPADMLAARRAHRRNTGELNEATTSIALRIKRKNGSYIWMEATTRLMRLPDTKPPLQVLACLRDISETRLIAEGQEALTPTGLEKRRSFDKALGREWRRVVRDHTH